MNLKNMGFEIVSENEYQDCIRITENLLFVVNKFVVDKRNMSEPCEIKPGTFRKLNKGLNKDNLYILVKPLKYYDWCKEEEIEFPVGQVLYNGYPIVKTNNPREWHCIVRTRKYAAWSVYGWKTISETISKLMNVYISKYENREIIED